MFDKKIRQQLEQRNIKPSSTAWERLQNELEHQPQKSPRKQIYYFAASIALLVGLFFWNNSSKTELPVVIQPKMNDPIINNNIYPKEKEIKVVKNEPNNQVAENVNHLSAKKTNSPTATKKNSSTLKVSEPNLPTATLENNSLATVYHENSANTTKESFKTNETELSLNLKIPTIEIEIDQNELLQSVENQMQTKKSKKIRQRITETLKNKAEDIGIAITY